jgi:phosphoribosylformimino-5-aminoimidazole carboxamide ribonucleotide (ProFAR) isomerase
MLLIPAIDLKDGHCVRLRQGDMNDSTIFSVASLDAPSITSISFSGWSCLRNDSIVKPIVASEL